MVWAGGCGLSVWEARIPSERELCASKCCRVASTCRAWQRLRAEAAAGGLPRGRHAMTHGATSRDADAGNRPPATVSWPAVGAAALTTRGTASQRRDLAQSTGRGPVSEGGSKHPGRPQTLQRSISAWRAYGLTSRCRHACDPPASQRLRIWQPNFAARGALTEAFPRLCGVAASSQGPPLPTIG